MRHVVVHNKERKKILIHCEDLMQVFPAQEGHSICVVRTKRRDGDQTFLSVNETVDQIEDQLRRLIYHEKQNG